MVFITGLYSIVKTNSLKKYTDILAINSIETLHKTFNEKSGLKEFAKVKELFPSLEYVPTLYYVDNREIKDELFIDNWDNAEKELKNWINKHML